MTNTPTGIKLQDLLSVVQATPLTKRDEAVINGCYLSDLLSDVLAHAKPGILWVTIQTHHNVVSVAAMKDIAAILITCGRKPDAAILAEAQENGIIVLGTALSSFDAAGRLWQAGLR